MAAGLLEDWRRYEKSLLQKLANRDKELRILHEDYIALELRCSGLMAVIRRQARKDRFEQAQRMAGANDG